MADRYAPRPEQKFSFGLWTVGNRGRDPFGDVVRDALPPVDAVALLAEVGAWGVNLHDNDLVPIDATPSERERVVAGFKAACRDHGGVRDFARGCVRTYLILKDRAKRWNADPEIQALVAEFGTRGKRGLGYERLDQLTMELLLGVRGEGA